MKPAERLAALKAIQTALSAEIKAAEHAVAEVRAQTGAKSFDTPLGSVTIATRKPSVAINDDREFLSWVRTTHPDAIAETVREADRKALLASLLIDGADVLTADGEVVAWAAVNPGSDYLTVRLSETAKASALGWARGWELE